MPIQTKQYKFSPEEKARFAAKTEAEILAAAQADEAALPIAADELRRAVAMRRLRLARDQREARMAPTQPLTDDLGSVATENRVVETSHGKRR